MDGIRISRTVVVPYGELEFRFSRSGGPGGQNVNTRDTRVEVVFDVARSPSLGPRQRARLTERLGGRLDTEGRLRVVASEERSQAQNRDLAVNRLPDLLPAARPPPRRPPARRGRDGRRKPRWLPDRGRSARRSPGGPLRRGTPRGGPRLLPLSPPAHPGWPGTGRAASPHGSRPRSPRPRG